LPVLVSFPAPATQRRWTVLIRWILCIPLSIVLYFIGIATEVVVIIGWFAALFTGRVPHFVRQLTTVYLRMSLRLSAYQFLLTDRFPSFEFEADPNDPTHIAVPEATKMNRLAVFFRIILVIPVSLLATLISIGAEILVVLMWFVVVITGRLPKSAHQAFAAALRFQMRISAYLFLLVPTYPSALFGERPPSSGLEQTADTPSWNLQLRRGGRRVLTLCIVLGALAYGGIIAVAITASVMSVEQQQGHIRKANDNLVKYFSAYDAKANACEKTANPYQCLEKVDTGFSQQIASYAHALAAAGNGGSAGVNQSLINNAQHNATNLAAVFRTLGNAPPTKAGYRNAVKNSGLENAVEKLQNSVNALASTIPPASGSSGSS